MMALLWLIVFGTILAAVLGAILLSVRVLSSERFRATIKSLLAVPLLVVAAIAVLAHWQQKAEVATEVARVTDRQHRTHKAVRLHGGGHDIRVEKLIVDQGEVTADHAIPVSDRKATAFSDNSSIGAGEQSDPAPLFPLPAAAGPERTVGAAQPTADKGFELTQLLALLSKVMVKTLAEGTAETAAETETRSPAADTSRRPAVDRTRQPGQPDWVDAPAQQVDGAYRVAVSVGPYATRGECERELPEALRAAVDEYASQYFGPEAAGRVRLPVDYLRENVVQEQWLETRRVSVSPSSQIPMVRLHVLLEFDRAVNDRLREAWRQAVIHGKLWILGTFGTMLLLLLSAFWAYLRVDLATRGAYRGRLRFATGLALTSIFLAGLAVLA